MENEPLAGLHWGIKASFLEYISRMPDGQGTIGDGARPAEGNVMVFEPSLETERPTGLHADLFLAFRGDIRFAGHHGMLYVRIADPWIAVHGSAAEMTVLDPYKPAEAPRLPLVRFTLEAATSGDQPQSWCSSDVRLTTEGTELFNNVYQPGELFEPLTIHLPADTIPPLRREGTT